ncbi:ATP-dependent 6-phosphofructokinase [Candidatus Woesearchaeota archaeon]|nr:ATP-dependent 6-phosphofructokinase [Candidatus Woesearchaeota archaeon]
MKRIGILTGGGDCPGLNPAIKAVVEKSDELGFEVVGIKEGWKGLLEATEDYTQPLSKDYVRTIDRMGGTILGTSRTNPFKSEQTEKVLLNNIKKLKLNYLVAIGGEDTLGVASKLYKKHGFPTVGIPKTIDKDLSETDYTLGFDSAVERIMRDMEDLRTTAGSHKRIFVVEAMGRHAGHLALIGGLAGGADIVLIPEFEFDVKKVNNILEKKRAEGKRYSMVVVAEGAKPKNANELTLDKSVDDFGHIKLGGIGNYLAKEIEKGTGMETRCVILSHLQRGGPPSAKDRRMGFYFGTAAVEALADGKNGKLVAVKNSRIMLVELEDSVKKLELVNIEKDYDTEHYNVKKTSMLGKQIYD